MAYQPAGAYAEKMGYRFLGIVALFKLPFKRREHIFTEALMDLTVLLKHIVIYFFHVCFFVRKMGQRMGLKEFGCPFRNF